MNLTDYLDTGLFLDHRLTRALIRDLAAGRRFLNLFAYTGSATVYAAAGGAATTTTVDLSPTYLEWARRNLDLNGLLGAQHSFVRADCLEWLDEPARGQRKLRPDLPRRPHLLQLQEHGRRPSTSSATTPALIRAADALLSPEGHPHLLHQLPPLQLDPDWPGIRGDGHHQADHPPGLRAQPAYPHVLPRHGHACRDWLGPDVPSNGELAELFATIAGYLALEGESTYRILAYEKAAASFGGIPLSIADMAPKGELRELPGVGEAIEAKVLEYIATGEIATPGHVCGSATRRDCSRS